MPVTNPSTIPEFTRQLKGSLSSESRAERGALRRRAAVPASFAMCIGETGIEAMIKMLLEGCRSTFQTRISMLSHVLCPPFRVSPYSGLNTREGTSHTRSR